MADDASIKIKFESDTADAVAGVGKVTGALKTVPAASNAAGDAVKKANDQLKTLPAAGEKAAGALSTLTGSIGGLKNIGGEIMQGIGAALGPIGIAGLATLATGAILELGKSFLEGGEDAARAAENIQHWNDELAKSAGSANAEIAQVEALISVAQDETQSRQTRTNAIKELQKEYPGYLGNLSIDKINTEETKKAVDALSAALIRKAQAQALSNLLSEKLTEIYKIQNTTLKDNVSWWTAATGSLKDIQKEADITKGDKLFPLYEEVNRLNDAIKALTKDQAGAGDFTGFKPETPKKIKDTGDSLEKVLATLAKFEQVSGLREITQGTNEVPKRIAAIESALERLYALKLGPENDTVRKLAKELEELKRVARPADFAPIFGKALPPSTLPHLEETTQKVHALADGIQQLSTAKTARIFGKDELENIKAFGELMQQYVQQPLESFFETVISGSGDAAEALGTALKQMIVKLIATTAAAAALAAILSLTGVGFVTGAGKVTDFKSIFGALSGLKGLATADGGIFSGPAMRLVGEYSGAKTNPEVIAPLNKLKGLMGGGNASRRQPDQVFVIRGADLVTATTRGQRFITR